MAKKEKLYSKDVFKIEEKLEEFPPSKITIELNDAKMEFFILGNSRDNSLIPETPEELSKLLNEGQIGQYVATSPNGKIYDIFIHKVDEAGYVRLLIVTGKRKSEK